MCPSKLLAAVTPLLAFYAFFATVLYPVSGALHPHGLLAAVSGVVPTGLHGLVKVRLLSM